VVLSLCIKWHKAHAVQINGLTDLNFLPRSVVAGFAVYVWTGLQAFTVNTWYSQNGIYLPDTCTRAIYTMMRNDYGFKNAVA
jgi:hypothetical protein